MVIQIHIIETIIVNLICNNTNVDKFNYRNKIYLNIKLTIIV